MSWYLSAAHHPGIGWKFTSYCQSLCFCSPCTPFKCSELVAHQHSKLHNMRSRFMQKDMCMCMCMGNRRIRSDQQCHYQWRHFRIKEYFITYVSECNWEAESQDSTVNVVTRLWDGRLDYKGSFPVGAGNFFFDTVQIGSGAHPALYPRGTGGCSFPGGKEVGVWSWPLTSIQSWGQRMHGAVPPLCQYTFMVWCLV
jgi:hypothetical protein